MLLAKALLLASWTWLLLGTLALIGTIALFSPRCFARLADRGSSWIDTGKFLSVLDKRVDIDQAVLPFSRVLGFAVIASAVLIAVLLQR